ncbi:MAG: hypothetical protein ACI90V_012051, partial [Bacillariaceae sp.]
NSDRIESVEDNGSNVELVLMIVILINYLYRDNRETNVTLW